MGGQLEHGFVEPVIGISDLRVIVGPRPQVGPVGLADLDVVGPVEAGDCRDWVAGSQIEDGIDLPSGSQQSRCAGRVVAKGKLVAGIEGEVVPYIEDGSSPIELAIPQVLHVLRVGA